MDSYVTGKTNKLRSDAPVLTAEVYEDKLGGAGNVVNNLLSLGANVHVVATFGYDDPSNWIVNQLNEHCNLSCIRTPYKTTPHKTRFVSGSQQLLRVDREVVEHIKEEDQNVVVNSVRYALINEDIDAVIISDYAKGNLPKELVTRLISLCNNLRVKTFVDPKSRNFSRYKNATCIKPNLSELYTAFNVDDGDGYEKPLRQLVNDYNLKYCLLTLSDQGLAILSNGTIKEIESDKKEIYYDCGAGDTTLATFVYCICKKIPPEESAYFANVAGGISCSQLGTYSVTVEDITRSINDLSHDIS